MINKYQLYDTDQVASPALIYYVDIIRGNIERAIEIAGRADRLWPHVKTHKSIDVVRLQLEYGIKNYKAATISEAEMAARAGAEKVLLAYPLVGPNINRFIKLTAAYPGTKFFAVGDSCDQLKTLSKACEAAGAMVFVLIDVNMGMNRTGVKIHCLEELYRYADGLEGIRLKGIHCYDGNHSHKNERMRSEEVIRADRWIGKVIKDLKRGGMGDSMVVAGCTPSFSIHAEVTDWYLSLGTAMIADAGCYHNFPDLDFIPGAAIMTRVISHPSELLFTVDLGFKGIALDPSGQKGYIVGMRDAVPLMQSEEHWIFRVDHQSQVPEIGTCLYIIPAHIGATTVLYAEILAARGFSVIDNWKVTARNRKINY